MAQKMQVLYTDDIDDIDGSDAQGTVRFGYDGADYEIDLSKKNADKLAKALAPFIEAGSRVPARRPGRGDRHASRHNQSEVRQWARAQGIKISDRGRIPADVMTQYQAAH
jgi:nucleoid-associated protein Lsr2